MVVAITLGDIRAAAARINISGRALRTPVRRSD